MAILLVGGVISLAYGALLILTKPKVGFVVQKEIERMPAPMPTPAIKVVEFTHYIPYLLTMIGLAMITAFIILKLRNVPLKSK